ncbi:MAG: integration host factor subunit beta [candidate division Zixibacteria bacterium]|nr:integration host factor subunit beta [Candidatus Tariuqbacter arcticus]
MKTRTYIKKDVVERVYQDVRKEIGDVKLVSSIVNATFAALRELMIQDELESRIEIRNFGVFEVKKTKAKPKARNPKTNEIIYVPPRRKTHFKPGKLLQDSLKKPID